MVLWTGKLQLWRICWNFREKFEIFHPKFRKKETISSKTNYTLSSKRSSGDVERSFDDHVEAFYGEANKLPFTFQKCFGGRVFHGKYIVPQSVCLDT